MIFYLAADFARKAEMQGVRHVLETLGHKVVSTWHDGDVPTQGFGTGGMAIDERTVMRCSGLAQSDLAELRDTEVVLFFTTGELSRGGRHTEFGYAVGLEKRVVIVGPRENVFQCDTSIVWFEDWSQFVMWISKGYLD